MTDLHSFMQQFQNPEHSKQPEEGSYIDLNTQEPLPIEPKLSSESTYDDLRKIDSPLIQFKKNNDIFLESQESSGASHERSNDDEDDDSDIYGSQHDLDSATRKRGKYKTFTDEERNEIITHMLKNGIDLTMKQYGARGNGITRKKLRSWLKSHDKVKKIKGRKTTDAIRDQKLYDWCMTFNKNFQRMPTRKEVTTMALKLSSDAEFKASKGWLDKFSKKHKLEFTPAKNVSRRSSKFNLDEENYFDSSFNDSLENSSYQSLSSPVLKDNLSDDCMSPGFYRQMGDLKIQEPRSAELKNRSYASPDGLYEENGHHNSRSQQNLDRGYEQDQNNTYSPTSYNNLNGRNTKPSIFARRNNKNMTCDLNLNTHHFHSNYSLASQTKSNNADESTPQNQDQNAFNNQNFFETQPFELNNNNNNSNNTNNYQQQAMVSEQTDNFLDFQIQSNRVSEDRFGQNQRQNVEFNLDLPYEAGVDLFNFDFNANNNNNFDNNMFNSFN